MSKLSKIILGAAGAIVLAFLLYLNISLFHDLEVTKQIAAEYEAKLELADYAHEQLVVKNDSLMRVIEIYEHSIDSLRGIIETKDHKISYLHKELGDAVEAVQSATNDENYEWLQSRYPVSLGDTLAFPLAGDQVKAIVIDLTQGDYTDSLYDATIEIAALQASQILKQDDIIAGLKSQNADLLVYADEIDSDLLEALAKNKEQATKLKDTKRKLRTWQFGYIATAGLSVGLVLILL